mgnify:CR=1 FL=1
MSDVVDDDVVVVGAVAVFEVVVEVVDDVVNVGVDELVSGDREVVDE